MNGKKQKEADRKKQDERRGDEMRARAKKRGVEG